MATYRRVASFNILVIVIIYMFCCVSSQGLGAINPVGNAVGKKLGFGRVGNAVPLQNEEDRIDRARQPENVQAFQQRTGQQQYQQQQQQANQGQYGQQQFRQNPNVNPNDNRPYNNQQADRSNVAAPMAPKRSTPIKISEQPDCATDVKTLCSASSLNNNFAVLDCLQNDVKVLSLLSNQVFVNVHNYRAFSIDVLRERANCRL